MSPEYLLEELEKNKDYVIRKASISNEEFQIVVSLLLRHIRIVPSDEYSSKFKEATEMINDIKDIAYVACCIALKCEGVWTSDSDFKQKEGIKTFNTAYLLKLM